MKKSNLKKRGEAGYKRLGKVRPVDMQRTSMCIQCVQGGGGRRSHETYQEAIKVWCLADSKNGYILNFEVYNGQAEPSNTAEEDQEISELWAYVVMSLS